MQVFTVGVGRFVKEFLYLGGPSKNLNLKKGDTKC